MSIACFDDPDIELVAAAVAAARNAYSPYSKFKVGSAALFAEHATIYSGCNVENASYGLTMCAERTAISAGVSAGTRTLLKLAVVVVDEAGNLIDGFMPCGACRQVIREFADDAAAVIIPGKGVYTVSELLPLPF